MIGLSFQKAHLHVTPTCTLTLHLKDLWRQIKNEGRMLHMVKPVQFFFMLVKRVHKVFSLAKTEASELWLYFIAFAWNKQETTVAAFNFFYLRFLDLN